MITIDGQKMARSLGNFITLTSFKGDHPLLQQAYHPMKSGFSAPGTLPQHGRLFQ